MMVDLCTEEMLEYGVAGQGGNLLGVQPFMTPEDYISGDAYFAKLDGYMQAAALKGWLNPRTIAVLPENVGTWLVSAGEDPAVARAPDLQAAMRTLVLHHSFAFARQLLKAKEKDRIAASLFRLKASQMAHIYHDVFSSLAKKYAVTVVAGSILLPDPQVCAGVVSAGEGPLYNISAVYRPDGQAEARLVRKSVLVGTERPFMTSAPISELPAFETPAGRLGVLVCADSWYPASYVRLKAQGVELLAVPSCITDAGLWNQLWLGYDGAAMPTDVDTSDVGRLTEGQAWNKYALPGRLAQAGALSGVNVFLRGALWGMGMDGNSLLVQGSNLRVEAQRGKAALLNLWL